MMPQSSERLRKKFEHDGIAYDLLMKVGYRDIGGGMIEIPFSKVSTPDEIDAMDYLFEEWDYCTQKAKSLYPAEQTLAVATYFHEGQTRKDNKTPYIVHPTAVGYGARYLGLTKYRREMTSTSLSYNEALEVLESGGNLHDVLEDCKEKGASVEELRKRLEKYFPKKILDILLEAVILLTKTENTKSYFEYLVAIKANPFARIIKLADLEHNLSDLAPGKLRDKYLLAQYYLTH
jgi:(p)ppGpp synthase/HD superfamily hydrolase